MMARYTKATISAAKALMEAGVGPKLLSRLSSIPFHTLKDWDSEKAHACVEPDPEVIGQLRALISR